MDYEQDAQLDEDVDQSKILPNDSYFPITPPVPNGLNIGQQPLCAQLPMEFDEMNATFEVNRLKAVNQLGLRHHAETVDVSLGLVQHSVYYKVAKKSKVLDRLLLYRMKQEEEESNGEAAIKRKEERQNLLNEVEARNVCYSADCRLMDGAECYSPDCRRFAALKEEAMKEETSQVHRLKVPQVGKAKKANWRVWMKENSVAMPPGPRVHTFRTGSSKMGNVLVLPTHVAKKLARKAGVQEQVEGFNHTGKFFNVWSMDHGSFFGKAVFFGEVG